MSARPVNTCLEDPIINYCREFWLAMMTGDEFKISNEYPVIKHTKNYRCVCDKLQNILNNVRKEISKGSWFYDIKKLGLPIKHFVASTNINDTVPNYLVNGTYEPKP